VSDRRHGARLSTVAAAAAALPAPAAGARVRVSRTWAITVATCWQLSVTLYEGHEASTSMTQSEEPQSLG
jgi:hypothetical protein